MRKIFSKLDYPLLILMVIYSIFGLIMIYSASSVSAVIRYQVPTYNFFVKQAIFLLVSYIVGFLIIIRFPTKNYKPFVWVGIFLIIFLLSLLFVKGKITGGIVKSWFDLGFFNLQPSEFAKSIIIIFSAVYYQDLSNKNIDSINAYLIPLGFGVIVSGLIAMQPDFGTSAIIGAISFLIFISIPIVKKNISSVIKIIFIGLLIGISVFLFSGKSFLNSNQMKRFEFRDPCQRYTEETGYQVCNGMIAIKNGGLFGLGLGQSKQKYLYLPESHTDFIFPIIVEELGLFAGIIIIVGYMYMLLRIFKIAKTSETLRCSILAYGTFWYLTGHILVNLLGVLGLMPLTGVPLPLLSYGGSFTVNVVTMLFIVQRVNIENKINKSNREIKAL